MKIENVKKSFGLFWMILILNVGAGALGMAEVNNSVLFDDDDSILSSGIYGLNLSSANVMQENGSVLSAEWIFPIKEKLYFGITVGGLTSNVKAPEDEGKGRLGYYYYGVLGEYMLYTFRVVETSGSLLIGLQQLGYRERDSDESYVSGNLMLLEPALHAYLRLTSRCKVGVAASYKNFGDPEIAGIARDDIAGLSYSLNLRTGVF